MKGCRFFIHNPQGLHFYKLEMLQCASLYCTVVHKS